ncbi:YtzI protein [Pseudalkalibacillus caeni]|uniref:YtzI protein n=1 Tax=Exobacillus caeni TaxID=2574798 RepID=A0A5R9EZ28_9BACL|nr:YtzI protein [Pseudalkalibacillus caeni]TLS36091.1 YtzI protein [Pseudalkalibacillus caeni]
MVLTVILITIAMTFIIALMFGIAVSKGYSVKHTVDPLPEKSETEENDNKLNER